MKRVWMVALLALFMAGPVCASSKVTGKVKDSSAVREWCESRSKRHFKKEHITPYNWTASWWDEVNVIVVEGQWQLESGRALVRCEAERGRPLREARISITVE